MARDPFVPAPYLAWDGVTDLDLHKERRAQDYKRQRIAWMREGRMGTAQGDDGRPLYTITAGGCWSRTKPVPIATRRLVLGRDGHACVLCGSTQQLEVDHIVRYIDGGSNEPENLRTLCYPCHSKRGGR